MKWSIALPSYNNFTEIWFTIEALRIYHDLSDKEIIVADNKGSLDLRNYITQIGSPNIKYFRTPVEIGIGPSPAKNYAISKCAGDYVICMDSHILLYPGVFNTIPPGDDLIQGPCISKEGKFLLQWLPKWRGKMWGIWDKAAEELPKNKFEIWAMGAGFLCFRRDSWLGFNPKFRGFGGETGYIQEKYRKYGRKVWCDPTKLWKHYFYESTNRPYSVNVDDRIRNYVIGFKELELPLDGIYEMFSKPVVEKIIKLHRL